MILMLSEAYVNDYAKIASSNNVTSRSAAKIMREKLGLNVDGLELHHINAILKSCKWLPSGVLNGKPYYSREWLEKSADVPERIAELKTKVDAKKKELADGVLKHKHERMYQTPKQRYPRHTDIPSSEPTDNSVTKQETDEPYSLPDDPDVDWSDMYALHNKCDESVKKTIKLTESQLTKLINFFS